MRLSLDIMSVDRSLEEPMHRQIYGALRRFILDGKISQNTLLPSTPSLAEDLRVGRNTVIAAHTNAGHLPHPSCCCFSRSFTIRG